MIFGRSFFKLKIGSLSIEERSFLIEDLRKVLFKLKISSLSIEERSFFNRSPSKGLFSIEDLQMVFPRKAFSQLETFTMPSINRERSKDFSLYKTYGKFSSYWRLLRSFGRSFYTEDHKKVINNALERHPKDRLHLEELQKIFYKRLFYRRPRKDFIFTGDLGRSYFRSKTLKMFSRHGTP